MDGIPIEVKPLGEEFVQATADRTVNVLIVEGPTGAARWWAVDFERVIWRLPRGPVVAPGTGTVETVREFMGATFSELDALTAGRSLQ